MAVARPQVSGQREVRAENTPVSSWQVSWGKWQPSATLEAHTNRAQASARH